jgi:branched-subunit amino acid transport protein
MVALAVMGCVVLTAINMIVGGEGSLGWAWLWVLTITPASVLMAIFLSGIFVVHDLIKAKNSN